MTVGPKVERWVGTRAGHWVDRKGVPMAGQRVDLKAVHWADK